MKLQKKSIIQNELAIQKKQEIDAGVRLAQKVDALREAQATEEANLTRFRDESVRIVTEEINDLLKKKSNVEREIQVAIEKREQAEKPTFEEIEIGKWRREELDKAEEEFLIRSKDLNEQLRQIDLKKKELEKEQSKIERNKISSESNLAQSEQSLTNAKSVLFNTTQKRKDSEDEIQTRTMSLMVNEQSVAIRERELEIKSEQLEIKAKELSDKEIFVNDKYQTLLRTIQRNDTRNSSKKSGK